MTISSTLTAEAVLSGVTQRIEGLPDLNKTGDWRRLQIADQRLRASRVQLSQCKREYGDDAKISERIKQLEFQISFLFGLLRQKFAWLGRKTRPASA